MGRQAAAQARVWGPRVSVRGDLDGVRAWQTVMPVCPECSAPVQAMKPYAALADPQGWELRCMRPVAHTAWVR